MTTLQVSLSTKIIIVEVPNELFALMSRSSTERDKINSDEISEVSSTSHHLLNNFIDRQIKMEPKLINH